MTKRTAVQLGLIVIAAAGILTGILLGQDQEVLRKAIRICLECIGIG